MFEPTTKIVANKRTGSVQIDKQMLIPATVMHAGESEQDDDKRVGLAVLSELLPPKAATALHAAFTRDFIAPASDDEVRLDGQQVIDWLQKQPLQMI